MRRYILGSGLILVSAVAALAPLPPAEVERSFSLGIYPPIQRAVTSATNLLPFSVLDVLLVFAVSTCFFAVARGARAALRARTIAPLARVLFNVASAAAAAYLVFLAVWGLNYRRVRMLERLELSQTQATTDAVAGLGLEAVRQLNSLHAEAHSIGWREPEWKSAPLRTSAAIVQRELTGEPGAVPGRLKDSILGPYFRWTGVDGMVNPFGLEVLKNPDLLAFERPFVAAHEWAHLAGFADESEANFVGFLTCVRASVPDQYSGWLYLYWQVAGEVDGRTRARLHDALMSGPQTDIDAVIARLRRGELPRLRVASWQVYDQYLKANRVEEGVRSYGAVINLLARVRFAPGWVPVLRLRPQP